MATALNDLSPGRDGTTTPGVEFHFFHGNGRAPNSRFPVVVYRDVVGGSVAAFEDRLRGNGWLPDWHSALGMFPRHHFHSDAHELIAVTKGRMTGLLGGHDGRSIELRTGDVVVIPAGVGHLGTSISDDLRLSGAFPEGFGVHDFRLCREDEYALMCDRSERVPVPAFDPIYGAEGPLLDEWRSVRAAGGERTAARGDVEMTPETPDIAAFDTLEDTSGYARPIEDFGAAEVSSDHLANLLELEAMLVRKRRYLVQDVMAYPAVYQARSQDIVRLQEMLSAVQEAMAQERILAGAEAGISGGGSQVR